ncbi:Uncharacterised protein [Mycobacterium tuberculosis]|uniref:Uncharacterized protein n=1 Tax=Mycobacterium tuberculosis TaxID=1773 RepID=A0A655ACI0_MYCTX|nr:Uncharacterised protein [Mycobacterium tuberculosis]CNV91461.1 Uncharacterised protein [Mycobacterium tuberculosis]
MPTSPAAELINTIDPPVPCSIRVGIATCTVWKTPVRLTSITSRQPSSPACIIAIPALATTMSSRPNSSRPACNATDSDARSRTSPCLATIPPPASSTSSTVAARSSAVLNG